MKNFFFYLGFAMLATHELDAVSKHEWRVLPLTSWLSGEYGFIVFLLIHIPLFAVLVALIASLDQTVRYRSRIIISLFLIIHGVLHLLFMRHTAYEFLTVYSNFLIFGGAFWGLAHVVLEFVDKKKSFT
jgi:hypothetical protein